ALRLQPRPARVAPPQSDDADVPPASPDLRRRLQPRPTADRPASQDPRPPRHGSPTGADGAMGGADPGPPARLHLLGAIRGKPAAVGAESRPRRRDGGAPRRGLAPDRADLLRALRASDAGLLSRGLEAGPLLLPARCDRVCRTGLPELGGPGIGRVDRAAGA